MFRDIATWRELHVLDRLCLVFMLEVDPVIQFVSGELDKVLLLLASLERRQGHG